MLYPEMWKDRINCKVETYFGIFMGITNLPQIAICWSRTPSFKMQAFTTYWWHTTLENWPGIYTFQTLKWSHHTCREQVSLVVSQLKLKYLDFSSSTTSFALSSNWIKYARKALQHYKNFLNHNIHPVKTLARWEENWLLSLKQFTIYLNK